VLLAAALALAAGCGARGESDPELIRIGFLPNVTHAVALSAKARGSFERALAPARVEWKPFHAGPQVVEAIYAGAIDAAYLGPGPAQNGFLRARGQELVMVAGSASGGAGLVVRRGLGIRSARDLHRRTVASPQLGNTQDVALRTWLAANDLRSTDRGGDVAVLPIENPNALTLMKRGQLDGAWVPEPWLTRLCDEAGGELLLDEAALWPESGGRFPTTVLVATPSALARKRPALERLVSAHVAEIEWLRAHGAEAPALIGDELARLSGKRFPDSLIRRALARVEPTWDPMLPALARQARDARALAYLPDGDLSSFFDRSLLDRALAARDGGAR
jgi:NitT/TauT family transport system substrate-binding protein